MSSRNKTLKHSFKINFFVKMFEIGSGGNELPQRGRARGRGQQCHGEEGKLCSRNKNFPFLKVDLF